MYSVVHQNAHTPKATPPRKIRVLLADDHVILRQVVKSLLSSQPDMEVAGEVSNGQAAVEAARQLQPDITLMDVSMPVLDGIEATRQITTAWPHIRVLGLSIYEIPGWTERMQRAGAIGLLNKITDAPKLCSAIRAAVKRHSTSKLRRRKP